MLKGLLFALKDAVYLALALSFALLVRSLAGGGLEFDRYSFVTHLALFIPVICISIIFFLVYGLYDKHVLHKRRRLIQHALMAGAGTFVAGIIWFYLFPLAFGLQPKSILLLYSVFAVCTAILARSQYVFLDKDGNKSSGSFFNVLPIGNGKEFKDFFEQLKANTYTGYRVVDIADIKNKSIQYIVIDTKDNQAVAQSREMYSLVFDGVKFLSFQDMYERVYDREYLSYIDEDWFMQHISGKKDYVYLILKRAMDLLIAIPLLLVSLLVYPFVWIAIKIQDGGPVFLYMDRIGQNNKIIKIIKFRSMTMDASFKEDGTWVLAQGKGAEDKTNEARQSRVTKVGKFIRKTRIDELPQLWNVIKGDLSLIGPRPEMPSMVEVYDKEIPFYSVRHTIRPGLSGWAQIHHEVPPHSVEGTKEKLSYDLYYLKHRSIFLDLLIALRTVQTLLSAVGL